LRLRRKQNVLIAVAHCNRYKYDAGVVALPVINECTRVAFRWRIGSSGPTAVNVMHFGTASTDLDALNTALNANVSSAMWLHTVNLATVYELVMTPLDGTTATKLYTPTGAKWIGNYTGISYNLHTATVVSLRTQKRGRRYRGRLYLPFVAEDAATNGASTAAVTAGQTAWDTFRTSMATASFPLVVATYGHSLHRTKTSGGGYTLTPVTWPPEKTTVTSTTLEATFGTQRRRQSRIRA